MGADRMLSKGVEATGQPVTIRFGSRSIETMAGLSVLAALVQAGEKVCRETTSGTRRGLFCGMGVCQECIVDIDGAGNQRACMTSVREGMVVNVAAPRPEAAPVAGTRDTVRLTPDLLVIGGGPAGLAAAAVAGEAGLDVVLIDERAKLGGQYYKQPAEGFRIDEATIDKQFRRGRALVERVLRAKVRHLSATTVWGVFGPGEIVASNETATVVVHPKRLVLATGAYERGVPLPGWTLPGFMTTGAAQTLLRSYQVPPGRRVLLGGNGPLNLQVAAELIRAGVTVVALAEAAEHPGAGSLASLAAMATAAPDLVRDGLAYQAVLRQAGVRTFHRHAVIRAEGTEAVERAVIAEIDGAGRAVPGTEKTFDVDAVCVGFGFLPSNEIARALGCRHGYDGRRGHMTAERDDQGRSSLPQVWIAGDAGGLGGARMAEAGGLVTGADVARDLGRQPCRQGEIDAARRTITRARRFQSALWTLFSAPRIVDQLADAGTLLCRCEEVSLATIQQTVASGVATAGAVKRLTRAGMGRCQGRYCGDLVVHMVARRCGSTIDEFSFFAPRVPFKPVQIATVSDVAE